MIEVERVDGVVCPFRSIVMVGAWLRISSSKSGSGRQLVVLRSLVVALVVVMPLVSASVIVSWMTISLECVCKSAGGVVVVIDAVIAAANG